MKGHALVLAHAHDRGAMAVAAQLSTSLGVHGVTTVRPETLGLGRWVHRIGSTSAVQTRLTLRSGAEIESSTVSCIFNRLQYLPPLQFHSATAKDRDYASAELQALVASWLYGLGDRVVNPAGPRGQAQGPVSRRGWLALAAECELPVARRVAATSGRMLGEMLPGESVRQREPWPGGVRGPAPVEVDVELDREFTEPQSDSTLLVAGERVDGPLAERFGPRCRELARRSGCTLLEIRFGRPGGEPVILTVDPFPLLIEPWAVAAAAELLLETADRHGITS